MRALRLSLVLVLFILTAGCEDLGEPSTDDMVNYDGTIVQESSQSYLIRTDIAFEDYLNTFYPLNLPDTFKRGGLRIRFSATLEIAPNAYYIYPPVRLLCIELIKR